MAKKQYTSVLQQDVNNFGTEHKTVNTEAAEAVKEAETEVQNEKQKDEDLYKTGVIPDNFLTRGTFYLTYEESEAIAVLSFHKMVGKSSLVRQILDKGLEELEPGILNEVRARAEEKKSKDFVGMSKDQRIKIMKKAAKD